METYIYSIQDENRKRVEGFDKFSRLYMISISTYWGDSNAEGRA